MSAYKCTRKMTSRKPGEIAHLRSKSYDVRWLFLATTSDGGVVMRLSEFGNQAHPIVRWYRDTATFAAHEWHVDEPA